MNIKLVFTERSGCTWSYNASSNLGFLRCVCALSYLFL